MFSSVSAVKQRVQSALFLLLIQRCRRLSICKKETVSVTKTVCLNLKIIISKKVSRISTRGLGPRGSFLVKPLLYADRLVAMLGADVFCIAIAIGLAYSRVLRILAVRLFHTHTAGISLLLVVQIN